MSVGSALVSIAQTRADVDTVSLSFHVSHRALCIAGWVAVALSVLGIAGWVMVRTPAIQFELGYAYEHGSFHGWTAGFARDDRKAAYWLEQAARQQHPRAEYRLGILNAHGWGVDRDSARAVEWLRRSAGHGYAPARYHLGWMYHRGDTVPRDETRALRLLEQAAAQGMAAAHYSLGTFYAQGDSVPIDPVRALMRYELALFHVRAHPRRFDNASFRPRIENAYMSQAGQMDTASQAQANRLARAWLSAHGYQAAPQPEHPRVVPNVLLPKTASAGL